MSLQANPANVTLPVDYTHISPFLWFIRIDSSGDIFKFVDRGGKCIYVGESLSQTASSLNALTNGTATSRTGVVFDNLAPVDSLVSTRMVLRNNNSLTIPGSNPLPNQVYISDTALALTPSSGFTSTGCFNGREYLSLTITDEDTHIAANQNKSFLVPSKFEGYNLTKAFARFFVAGGTGTCTVQVQRIRSGTTVEMLSTNMTFTDADIDSGTTAVINTANDDLLENDLIRINIATETITGPKPFGLVVLLEFGDGSITDEYVCDISLDGDITHYLWQVAPGAGNGLSITVTGWEIRR